MPKLRRSLRAKAPNLSVERELWSSGRAIVVGIDEVGRGSWAGPLTVGAAVVPQDRRVYKVRDSKMLSEPEREAMYGRIAPWCEAWGIGHASALECDELGMSEAQRLAARRALDALGLVPDAVLIDGNWDFVGTGNTIRIVRGDATSLSISAASILAKVTRDRMLRSIAPMYPGYAFDENKGYPCPRHKAALHASGPTAVHRRSWAFMDSLAWGGVPKFVRPEAQGTLFDV